MAEQQFIIYRLNGTAAVVKGNGIFDALKKQPLPDRNLEVDFFTEKGTPKFVYDKEKKEWVHGDNPELDKLLEGDKINDKIVEIPPED